ncbi:MAG: type II toxin-antitoxin system VapC family toxin [Chloroflexi bacterium]|nr:type II toxin-antitoxin system VapC family toxin [Chloroflexota bacterium]
MKVAFDTSVLVASLVRQHPRHAAALSVVHRVLQGRDHGHVAAHGLAETYAVLTTLPLSPRISPETAHRLVTANVVEQFEVVALTAREYAVLVASLPERGIAGGSTYDAIHAACAAKAGVERLFTFNVRDFTRAAPELADRITSP